MKRRRPRRLPARLSRRLRRPHHHRRRPRHPHSGRSRPPRHPRISSAPKSPSISTACYSPDRVLYPMRRVTPKGPVTHPAVAGDRRPRPRHTSLPAHHLGRSPRRNQTKKFEKHHRPTRPEAILPYSYGAPSARSTALPMDRRFFHRLGASQLGAHHLLPTPANSVCNPSSASKMGTEPEQFVHSRYIIAWASNIHGNNVHLWPFIEREEARRKGAKLVVIDPYRTRHREVGRLVPAHQSWHRCRAGSGHDGTSSSAKNLFDADYVSRYTVGFEDLKARAQQYPPEKVAHWTGISAADIRQLAREYATRAAVRNPRQLRHSALRRRRYGDARRHHAALSQSDRGRTLAVASSSRPAVLSA